MRGDRRRRSQDLAGAVFRGFDERSPGEEATRGLQESRRWRSRSNDPRYREGWKLEGAEGGLGAARDHPGLPRQHARANAGDKPEVPESPLSCAPKPLQMLTSGGEPSFGTIRFTVYY